ncbi:peroxiredoxin [Aquimarina intermedia]|uniref:thioredoxin-dependent peroxiredoxin n=1 Tax=Aquimarina intermedia TaxID=350814 RepID=A0A5S5C1C2_9FLAO|nr:peroxiredoxin [Aquimarina intermedia]TYP72969.1 peroxiredoxin Q/BCP [Aquimarina intermedia]
MGLNIGDKIPEFTGKDDSEKALNSKDLIGVKPFVIYFYPKNFTPGCTKEACDFRDNYEEFEEYGVEVIGVSGDSVSSHQRFKAKYKLPFQFISDSNGELRELFGVESRMLGLLPGRETFVVNRDGILVFKFNSIKATHHFKMAITKVKELVNE